MKILKRYTHYSGSKRIGQPRSNRVMGKMGRTNQLTKVRSVQADNEFYCSVNTFR